ncbi:GldG family protein [Candidatus Peregrinibacteria bacterium]|nr:MAG: GldG family protein [Candidatus Peregrinibacteria bacterium]
MNFLNRFQFAKYSALSSLLVFLILLLVNGIGLRHFFRLDLTHNQFYALSDGSKALMNDLDDLVNVNVYFSNTLPTNLFFVRQYLEDILDELSSYSHGQLQVTYLNPDLPEVAEEALAVGVPQVQMNLIEKDKFEVKNGFLGISISYGDQTEVLPVVQTILNIEYDLVSAIKKVTAAERKKIGFVTGHQEPALENNLSLGQRDEEALTFFRQGLERNYEVVEVKLSDSALLNTIDTLVIAGSKQAYTADEQYALDQYLLNGGNVIVFLDGLGVSPELVTTAQSVNLFDQIKHYGASINPNQLVLDVSNERVSFNDGYLNFLVAYPYWVKAVKAFFDQDHPVVGKLNSIVFPWVSSIQVSPSDSVAATVLVRSSEQAWSLLAAEGMSLSPQAIQAPTSREQSNLAVLLSGSFSSFFEARPALSASTDSRNLDFSRAPAQLLVVGSARFITDAVVEQFEDNLSFALNAVDYLTLDDSLIDIRSKRSFETPLKELTLRQRQLVKWIGILLVPMAVVAYGTFRFIRRRALTQHR